MFIDEAVWRAEHQSLPAKREALCLAFGVDLWEEEQRERDEEAKRLKHEADQETNMGTKCRKYLQVG